MSRVVTAPETQLACDFSRTFAGDAYSLNMPLMIDRLTREEFLIEASVVAAL
jgi:hypothetical protein